MKKKIRKKSSRNQRMRKKYRKLKNLVFDILLGISISLFLFLLVGRIFFSIHKVDDNSMYPLLKKENKMIVRRGKTKINRFDIIAFKNGSKIEFRRVIGLPKERVKYEDDYLTINDELVDEKFIIDQINEYGKKSEVYTRSKQGENGFQMNEIPRNYYLVLGDNRPNATDSRQYGLVSKDKIIGKSSLMLSPLRTIK